MTLAQRIKKIVDETPNNMELGKKIRSLMWEHTEDALLSNNPDDGSWFNR